VNNSHFLKPHPSPPIQREQLTTLSQEGALSESTPPGKPFHELSWDERKKKLGRTSELAFEAYATSRGILWERFGMDQESSLKYFLIPAEIRLRPDYLCQLSGETFFVEVKSVDRHGVTRIKPEAFDVAEFWSKWLPVKLFLFDVVRQRCTMPTMDYMQKLIQREQIETARFKSDGNIFYPVPADLLKWTAFEFREPEILAA